MLCSKVISLTAPYGKCGFVSLTDYSTLDEYTSAKCQMECVSDMLVDLCGCKAEYMPGQLSR